MKVLVAGGTGFIGRHVCHALLESQHEVTVLSRNPDHAQTTLPPHVSIAEWNPMKWNGIERHVERADAIINLAGEPIADSRWTPSRKQLLTESRIETTRRLVNAIGNISEKPKVLMNASGIGFYGSNDSISMSESSPQGEGFLAELCQKWEAEANRATEYGVRVICLRIGMVLGADGGALSKMIMPFKLFVGGPISPGTQKVSWIHIHDLAQLVVWLLDKETISGPVNAVTPHAVTMREFCKSVGQALNRPSWLPVPGVSLKLLLGELSDLLTTGQQVEPLAITEAGYHFNFPKLDHALESLFHME